MHWLERKYMEQNKENPKCSECSHKIKKRCRFGATSLERENEAYRKVLRMERKQVERMADKEKITSIEPSCDDVKAAYEQGLNDAWELAKKIQYGLSRYQLKEIFGTDNEAGILSDVYTPQEALAKLKAHEEAQIMVGDVVEVSDEVGIVVKVAGNCANVVHDNGNVTCVVLVKDLKKTGKHIDIQSILSQIGGE